MATTFLKNSGWTDADKDGKLEKEISGIRQSLRATILVNQENAGRVQIASKLKEELTAIGDLCVQYGVTVVSDEIHGDFIFKGGHQVFTAIKKEYEDITITCTAPSKTFNIAGIVTSYAIVPNDRIREEFYSFLEAGEFGDGTIFAYTATTAAYTYGAE